MTGVSFTTSWDDGHPLDLRVAELLAKYECQGTFFVPRHNIEGRPVLTPHELRILGERFEIGGHTLDHRRLPSLGRAQAEHQILAGKTHLEDELGRPVIGFCYPGGEHNKTIRHLVRDAGFHYARTIENFRTSAPVDRFRIPTTIQLFPHSRFTYSRNFVRGRAWPQRAQLFCRSAFADSLESRLEAAFRHVELNGGVFHLWGHSWEIEQMQLWPLFERFLDQVRQRVPAAQRVSNAGIYANSATH